MEAKARAFQSEGRQPAFTLHVDIPVAAVNTQQPSLFSRLLSTLAGLLVTLAVQAGMPSDQIEQGTLAATSSVSTTAQTTDAAVQTDAGLIARANSEGSIPVIVRLRLPDALESAGAMSERARQSALVATQQQVLDQLGIAGDRDRSGATIKRFAVARALAMRVTADDLLDLQNDPRVSGIVEDVAYPPALLESVPLIGASADRSFSGYTGKGQAVAILDTGVDKNHPFISGKIVSEACYSSNYPASGIYSVCPGGVTDSTASGSGIYCNLGLSGCSHGTHVAGIAAGRAYTLPGTSSVISGVAKDANLIAIQVFTQFPASSCGGSPCVMAYTSDIIKGLERVYSLSSTYQIAAANLSLGGGGYTSPCDSDPTKAVIDKLITAGIATVIASGNNGYANAISSPGCVSTAVTVGSTTKADAVSSFSNSASFLDLLAPGSSIDSSVAGGGGFEYWSGTSMATPHVTGAWAVMKSVEPTASVTDVLTALKSAGVSIKDPDNGLTFPRLQLDKAITALGVVGIPSTPTATAASGLAASGFTANWGSVGGAESYRLDVSTSSTFASYVSGYQNLDVGAVTSRAVTGLAANSTYYYRVRATNDAGTSPNSAVIKVTTLVAAPTAKAATKITPTGFTASWGSVSGAKSYRLDVSTSDTFASFVTGYQDLSVGTATSRAISKLTPDTTYYYRVRATGSSGTSASSDVIAVATTVAAPAATAASALGSSGFTANWGTVSGATSYLLDVSTSKTFGSFVSGYQNLDVGTATSRVVTGLASNTTYYYRLRAANSKGVSPNSNVVTVKTSLAPPAAPLAKAATKITISGFTASWSAVSTTTAYRLDVSASAAFDSFVGSYQNFSVGTATSRAITGLARNTTYYYRVRATNSAGSSPDSNPIMVKTAP